MAFIDVFKLQNKTLRAPHMTEEEFIKLRQLRHALHANPELSRREFRTAERLKRYLAEHAPPDETVELAGAGFAAVYSGAGTGRTVLVRAELDALPIQEANDVLPYRSEIANVSHKCGHDGHMTILTGLARALSRERPSSGRVVLLFQPDEETGTGAGECCEHENFAKIRPDYAFALHNFPGFPKHEILCRTGVFMSAVRCMVIKFAGKEAHSAMPETGASPALAIAQLTQAAEEIQQSFDKPEERALIVPVAFKMGFGLDGKALGSGISPGFGEAHFTLRSPHNDIVGEMWRLFAAKAEQLATRHGLSITFDAIEHFSASINDGRAVSTIQQAATQNGLTYTELAAPFRAGEDFGEITSRYTGAMFGLGAGENCAELHNPDYDFPDDLIPTGVRMFKSLVDRCLSN